MNEKLKKIFLSFQYLKLEEKKYILCSIIGCISTSYLNTLQLTLEPFNHCYRPLTENISILDNIDEKVKDFDDIDVAARYVVRGVIEFSVKYLRTEFLKSTSFDKYLLSNDEVVNDNIITQKVIHVHADTIQKKTDVNHIRGEKSIFQKKDTCFSIIQSLTSKNFMDEDRKRFVMEILFFDEFDVQKHICLCVKKRLEERWTIDTIPDNILIKVFMYLLPLDLISSSQVSKQWNKVSRCNAIWKYNCSKYAQEIGLTKVTDLVVELIGEKESIINWFEIYKTFRQIFTRNNPKKGDLKIEKLSFLQEKLPVGKNKAKRKPKTVRLSPVKTENGRSVSNNSMKQLSKSDLQLEPNPDNDKRQLMKPILGQLKRFQNADEFAVDCRSNVLNSLQDNTNRLESKIHLKWINLSTDGTKNNNTVKKMTYIDSCFRLTGHLDGVTSVKCDKVRLASSSRDGTIRMWDVVTGRSLRKMVGHKGGIYCLDFNSKILVSGGWDMSLIVWSLQPDFDVLKIFYGHKSTINAIAIIEEKDIIISASMDGTLRYHSISRLQHTKVVQFPLKFTNSNGIRDMRVQQSINCICTAHNDRTIRITDIDQESSTIEVGIQVDLIRSLFFQSQLIISGGTSGYLQFWEVDIVYNKCISKAQIQIKNESKFPLVVESICYYIRSLWTGHDDGSVKEWHLGSMTCLRTIIGHKGPVKSVCFMGTKMITASSDATIRLWQISNSNNGESMIDKYGSFRDKLPVYSVFK